MSKHLVLVKLSIALACLALIACNGVSFRAAAQGAVRTMAHAVSVADKVCASAIDKRLAGEHTHTFGKACVVGYKSARGALLASEAAIDAHSEGSDGRVVCALARSVDAIASMRDVVAQFTKPPKEIDDAIELARWASSIASASCEAAK